MKRAVMILAAVTAVMCGVGGLPGALTGEHLIEDGPEAFSPLFRDRLEIGVRKLDQAPDRVWPARMAGQRMEIILSGTPGSICLASACAGSICLGSGCVSSNCVGSGCMGSGCAGSACLNSNCFGSVCVGSKCFGSACTACAEEPGVEEQA